MCSISLAADQVFTYGSSRDFLNSLVDDIAVVASAQQPNRQPRCMTPVQRRECASITVTEVRMSPDLRHAISVLDEALSVTDAYVTA